MSEDQVDGVIPLELEKVLDEKTLCACIEKAYLNWEKKRLEGNSEEKTWCVGVPLFPAIRKFLWR